MNTINKEEVETAVVCIVGMHRSGTSMVTRLLNLCGLDLGAEQDLLGPDKGNPLGHFENIGFKSLDESLLAHFGGSTDNPPDLEPNWQDDSSLHVAFEEARVLLATFKGKTVWGWKEPRTTLLIPFWRRLLPDARFVICVRNPLEVARSIAERDGMPLEKGFHLWNCYTRAAVRDTEGCPRIFTFYEDHFTNGLSEIERVAKFCGLGLPREPSTLQRVVYRELRHHSCSTADLLNSDCVPNEYKFLYIGLRFLSGSGSVASLGSAREEETSKNIGAFLRSMNEFHKQEPLAGTQELLLKRNYELTELRSQLKQIEKQVETLVEENTRLQRFSDAVRRTVIYRMYCKFIRPLRGQ
jgi:Sulfotransferase family